MQLSLADLIEQLIQLHKISSSEMIQGNFDVLSKIREVKSQINTAASQSPFVRIE